MTGLESLKKRLAGMQARVANPRPGLIRSAMVVLKAAKQHIQYGGYGKWAPNLSGTPLLFQSGRLMNSLAVGAPDNKLDISGNTATVGTVVGYARYLQMGTGIYGPSGTPIKPTSGKALAFQIGGKTVFARSVKGVPPRPFLYIDGKIAEQVRTVWGSYIMNGMPGLFDDG